MENFILIYCKVSSAMTPLSESGVKVILLPYRMHTYHKEIEIKEIKRRHVWWLSQYYTETDSTDSKRTCI